MELSQGDYKIVFTKEYFKKETKFFIKHPNLRTKYQKMLSILSANPKHPSLRLHKLNGKMQNCYSISIDLSYRVIISFIVKNNQIFPIDIGDHDIYH